MPYYRKKELQFMAAWSENTLRAGVSISQADLDNGSPKHGDMIAVSASDPEDRWLVSAEFLADNYELVEEEPVKEGASVTQNAINELVSAGKTQYIRVEGTTTTICAITLSNGYTVTGNSACVSPANFNEALGQQIAHKNAIEKVWELEGYLLNDQLNK